MVQLLHYYTSIFPKVCPLVDHMAYFDGGYYEYGLLTFGNLIHFCDVIPFKLKETLKIVVGRKSPEEVKMNQNNQE